jgi:hypothetical protein
MNVLKPKKPAFFFLRAVFLLVAAFLRAIP